MAVGGTVAGARQRCKNRDFLPSFCLFESRSRGREVIFYRKMRPQRAQLLVRIHFEQTKAKGVKVDFLIFWSRFFFNLRLYILNTPKTRGVRGVSPRRGSGGRAPSLWWQTFLAKKRNPIGNRGFSVASLRGCVGLVVLVSPATLCLCLCFVQRLVRS